MKRFNNLKMVLFDSTNSAFRLAVEASFVRGNQQQGFKDLVYVTDQGNGALNPNIYLTFTYKGGDNKAVYTSYPQLYKIREAFNTVKDMVADRKAYLDVDGTITVKPEYATPVVLANIGKSNNWISIAPIVMETGENGVINHEPAVSIELSTSGGYASVLTIDEFLTVYTIINDLDLAGIQCQVSLAFLQATDVVVAPSYPQNSGQPAQTSYSYPNYQYTQQPQYQQPQYQYAPRPTSTTVQPQQFNGSPQGYQARVQQSRKPYQPSQVVSTQPGQPTQVQQPTRETEMPARQQPNPIMNPTAIEETPISEITYDDMDAIDNIFNN